MAVVLLPSIKAHVRVVPATAAHWMTAPVSSQPQLYPVVTVWHMVVVCGRQPVGVPATEGAGKYLSDLVERGGGGGGGWPPPWTGTRRRWTRWACWPSMWACSREGGCSRDTLGEG